MVTCFKDLVGPFLLSVLLWITILLDGECGVEVVNSKLTKCVTIQAKQSKVFITTAPGAGGLNGAAMNE